MADIVRWEEPPKAHGNTGARRTSSLQPVADALRERQGEWAVIKENVVPGTAGSLAARIRKGLGPWGPEGSFEAKCIGPAGGSSSKVYARYVGGAGEA